MRTFCILTAVVVCVLSTSLANVLDSYELAELQETCCTHGQTQALRAESAGACATLPLPELAQAGQDDACRATVTACCQEHFLNKDDCILGMKYSAQKKCDAPNTEIGKSCCEECGFGRLTGQSGTSDSCGGADSDELSPSMALRSFAYSQCCLAAVKEQETTTEKPTTTQKPTTTTQKPTTTTQKPTTTTQKPTTTTEKPTTTSEKPTTTTEKKVETTTNKKAESTTKEKCQEGSCEQICNDESGKVTCQCHSGYKLQDDNKSCKDINECREADDDVCTNENEVCHNTEGSFRCVPLKKREVGSNCPPGFKMNVLNQVCDDVNECQLPRPPCPKYLCENTIGGYKCGGKPGKPFDEAPPLPILPPKPSDPALEAPKNDICPPGFRAGPDDECLDVDECEEHTDDCQRLSQYCINTNGGFFCQDHVSRRCAPGFMANRVTGICEDIDECEESGEVCNRSQVCINLAGAYNCKSKISTLPKLAKTTCQEGTRMRPGGSCEDIDECREGTHLCDQFQNCVNTYGGHECRCKNGFELDSVSSACEDVDECALKLDNCAAGERCVNLLGSFRCTRRAPTTTARATSTRATTPRPAATEPTPGPTPDEYYYYDSSEDKSSTDVTPDRTTPKPKPTEPPRRPTYPETTQPHYTPYQPPRQPEPRPQPEYPRPEDNLQPHEGSTPERRPEYRPRSTEAPKPYSPPRTNPPPQRYPTEVTVDKPTESTVVVEKEKDKDGGYGLNTSDIPKNQWTNVIGKEKPEDTFNINDIHCLNGFELDARGNCVDIDECEGNKHICSNLEKCTNLEGGYRCDCVAGYRRDPSGWCVPTRPPTTPRPTTPRPTTPRPTTPRPTTPRLITPRPTTPMPTTTTVRRTRPTTISTTSTTTERTTIEASSPRWYTPNRPRRPKTCELGYTYDSTLARCVDIDECVRDENICGPKEDCVNEQGGYYCVCGPRCRSPAERNPSPPSYEPTSPSYSPVDPGLPPRPAGDPNVITVGAQYGQRGPRYLRPTFTRLPNTGAIVTTCPWGYKLTVDKMCYDIDECAKNVSKCGPQQRCENFNGGYSCQCPSGYQLKDKDGCEDINECAYGQPCPGFAKCVNTEGSYYCACGHGFRNSPSNDKVCVDINECMETPQVCHQSCSNAWGSYRCYCERGYRLASDNRTCVDVDECEEWGSGRLRGRLCSGVCVNEPGSYRCTCPAGYRLSEDHNSCIDIDECTTGDNPCGDPKQGHVCQNTRGSYHCHHIQCPPGYQLEKGHKCNRIQTSCAISDWGCLQRPSSYSYQFITFVANIYLPSGSVDLFTMYGPSWHDSSLTFELRMVNVQPAPNVRPAELRCFDMRPMGNSCLISLLCSLGGPQVAELELTMSLYQRGQFAGTAVARLIVIVSQYEY